MSDFGALAHADLGSDALAFEERLVRDLVLGGASTARVGWRTDRSTGTGYNRVMRTSTSPGRRPNTEESTLAAALWVLAATAWFVMAVLFIRHGLFSAIILLLTALICLPGLRAAFRHLTGIRVPWLATATTALALALGGVISAARNNDPHQLRQQPAPSAGEEAAAESKPETSMLEAADIGIPTPARTAAMGATGP